MNFPAAYPRKVSETHLIVWLDAFIGEDGQCQEFKRRFQGSISPDHSEMEDPIELGICAIGQNACKFEFAHQSPQALQLIENNPGKNIIFISSGSMGQQIVPTIRDQFPNVYSFYIFCALRDEYRELLLDNLDCLKIFTHEVDLLVRLMRDIAPVIVERGHAFESLDYFIDAFECFVRARNLYFTANFQDTLHPPILTPLVELEGPDGRSGIIGRFRDRIIQEGGQLPPTPFYPRVPDLPNLPTFTNYENSLRDENQPTEIQNITEPIMMETYEAANVQINYNDNDTDDDSLHVSVEVGDS